MRRPIVLPDVGLEFDNPSHPPTRRVIADQAGSQQGARGLKRRSRKGPAIEDGQLGIG
jgi:hypothetical protein